MREDIGAIVSAFAIFALLGAGFYFGTWLFKSPPQETAFSLPPIERVFPNSVPALPE